MLFPCTSSGGATYREHEEQNEPPHWGDATRYPGAHQRSTTSLPDCCQLHLIKITSWNQSLVICLLRTKPVNRDPWMSHISTFFFLKFLADICPFLGPLVPLFWISGDVSSGFQSQSGLPYSHCGGKHNVRSPRSTSGATLADLLVAGAQPVLSPHTVPEVRLPGFELVVSE